MSPPNELPPNELRPGAVAEAGTTFAGSGVKVKLTSTAPARRFCLDDVHRRRHAARQLDAILGRTYPSEPCVASTFDLSPDELRRHANDLAATGWRVDEIIAVLDVAPATR